MGKGSKGGPYEPGDFGERIFKTHDEGRTLKTRNEEKTIKNTNLTPYELTKLTGKPVNTTRLYVKRENYAKELDLYLLKKRGWRYQRTEKTETVETGKITGCTPGPLGIITYPILPKWRTWLQDDLPRPRQTLRRLRRNRPRIL